MIPIKDVVEPEEKVDPVAARRQLVEQTAKEIRIKLKDELTEPVQAKFRSEAEAEAKVKEKKDEKDRAIAADQAKKIEAEKRQKFADDFLIQFKENKAVREGKDVIISQKSKGVLIFSLETQQSYEFMKFIVNDDELAKKVFGTNFPPEFKRLFDQPYKGYSTLKEIYAKVPDKYRKKVRQRVENYQHYISFGIEVVDVLGKAEITKINNKLQQFEKEREEYDRIIDDALLEVAAQPYLPEQPKKKEEQKEGPVASVGTSVKGEEEKQGRVVSSFRMAEANLPLTPKAIAEFRSEAIELLVKVRKDIFLKNQKIASLIAQLRENKGQDNDKKIAELEAELHKNNERASMLNKQILKCRAPGSELADLIEIVPILQEEKFDKRQQIKIALQQLKNFLSDEKNLWFNSSAFKMTGTLPVIGVEYKYASTEMNDALNEIKQALASNQGKDPEDVLEILSKLPGVNKFANVKLDQYGTMTIDPKVIFKALAQQNPEEILLAMENELSVKFGSEAKGRNRVAKALFGDPAAAAKAHHAKEAALSKQRDAITYVFQRLSEEHANITQFNAQFKDEATQFLLAIASKEIKQVLDEQKDQKSGDVLNALNERLLKANLNLRVSPLADPQLIAQAIAQKDASKIVGFLLPIPVCEQIEPLKAKASEEIEQIRAKFQQQVEGLVLIRKEIKQVLEAHESKAPEVILKALNDKLREAKLMVNPIVDPKLISEAIANKDVSKIAKHLLPISVCEEIESLKSSAISQIEEVLRKFKVKDQLEGKEQKVQKPEDIAKALIQALSQANLKVKPIDDSNRGMILTAINKNDVNGILQAILQIPEYTQNPEDALFKDVNIELGKAKQKFSSISDSNREMFIEAMVEKDVNKIVRALIKVPSYKPSDMDLAVVAPILDQNGFMENKQRKMILEILKSFLKIKSKSEDSELMRINEIINAPNKDPETIFEELRQIEEFKSPGNSALLKMIKEEDLGEMVDFIDVQVKKESLRELAVADLVTRLNQLRGYQARFEKAWDHLFAPPPAEVQAAPAPAPEEEAKVKAKEQPPTPVVLKESEKQFLAALLERSKLTANRAAQATDTLISQSPAGAPTQTSAERRLDEAKAREKERWEAREKERKAALDPVTRRLEDEKAKAKAEEARLLSEGIAQHRARKEAESHVHTTPAQQTSIATPPEAPPQPARPVSLLSAALAGRRKDATPPQVQPAQQTSVRALEEAEESDELPGYSVDSRQGVGKKGDERLEELVRMGWMTQRELDATKKEADRVREQAERSTAAATSAATVISARHEPKAPAPGPEQQQLR